MKFLLLPPLFLFFSFQLLRAQSPADPKAIRQFPLDDRAIYELNVGINTVTTITFPGPISALEGASVTADPKVPAPLLLAYKPGRPFFSVRALQPEATGQINVIWQDKTYVLRLVSGTAPLCSVRFYKEEARESGSGSTPKGAFQLLALLDRAKAYPLVRQQHPELVPQLDCSNPGNLIAYRDFDVVVNEVYRFDAEDTLVFRLLFINRSLQETTYVPKGICIRVGSQIYPCAVTDASGTLPPATSRGQGAVDPSVTVVYAAVTGKPDGGRNNLSVRNTFNVLVPRETALPEKTSRP